MKIKLPVLFISLILSSILLSAQESSHSYLIKLKDKGNSRFTLSKPSDYLAQKSIERRIIQEIPLNNTDLPISESYLQTLRDNGAEIYYKSKWLNIVMANLDTEEYNTIIGLPFVERINPIQTKSVKKNDNFLKRFFVNEKVQKLDESKLKHASKTGSFDYGASANQVQMLKIDQIHDLGYTGAGMVIAVIDGGFNSVDVMEVFDSLFTDNRILGTRDFVEPGNNIYNTSMSSHGTMVLSTMGGNLPGQLVGTAPHASYYLLRSEDTNGEYLMEEYYWINAAEYADSVGVDVINTSLGYTTFDNPAENHTYEDMDGDTAPITIGADLAAAKGMLVVNSAGNEGNNSWTYISAPADGDSVLTVGAVDAFGNYAFFSSRGPTYDGRIKPEVAAQGKEAVVASPYGISMANGTSFSSPILSGAITCFWQANPTYSNMEIIALVKQSASITSNPDNLIGWGIPDFVLANSLTVTNELEEVKTKFYPNPFKDYIQIDIEDTLNGPVLIKIINSSGRVVKEQLSDNSTKIIQVSGLGALRSGVYFIQITYNNTTYNQKLIK